MACKPEPNPAAGKKDVVWFARDEDRPLVAADWPFSVGRNPINPERSADAVTRYSWAAVVAVIEDEILN
jgi:hypothetical protein